jgi:hypothetical protein
MNPVDDLERELHLFIFQLEEEFGLFEKNNSQIGIIWYRIRQIVSDTLSNRLQKAIKGEGEIHSPFNKKITLLKLLGSVVNKNPFLSYQKNKLIIFQNSRRVYDKASEKFTDLFTDPIINGISNEIFYILEEPWSDGHKKPSLNIANYLDFNTYLSYFIGLLSIPFLTTETKVDIKRIEKRIYDRYGVSLDIKNFARKTLLKRNGTYYVYLAFFYLSKPKGMLYVALNTDLGVVEAANRLGIPTIEVQHGILGMSYILNVKVPQNAIPKYFLSFGKGWDSNFKLPGCMNINVGYPFIDEKKQLFANCKKEKFILVISDGNMRMCDIAIRMAKKYIQLRVIFRLKPSEFDDWKIKYPKLFWAMENSILDVSSDDHESVHDLLAKCEYLIGTCSILIYEGLAMRCRTVVVKGPGYSYLRYLIDEKWVYLANEDDIDISMAPFIECRDIDNLFLRNSVQNIREFIDELYLYKKNT